MKTLLTILALSLASITSAATYTAYFEEATGGTYYAYPRHRALTDWTTYRVALTEGSDDGDYSGTLDTANGTVWHVFSGSTEPTTWDASLTSITLATPIEAASILGAQTSDWNDSGTIGRAIGLARSVSEDNFNMLEPMSTASADMYANGVRVHTIDAGVLIATGDLSTDSELGTAVWATAARTITALDEDTTTIDLNGSLVGGITGTITSLDALDTAQDTQHTTTQGALTTIDNVVDSILVDTAEIGVAGAGLTAADDATITAITNIDLSVVTDQLDDIEADIAGISSGSTYTKDTASKSRTWNFTPNTERITSPNTITEAAAFNGEVCFDLSNVLNPGAGILNITSVTASPSSGVTVGTPAKTSDNKKAIVNVSGHTAGTTYTYTITVSTTDGDTALVRKGVLVAE